MITFKLHGHLKETFGPIFKFEVQTVQEGIRALVSNFRNFKQELIKDGRAYHIIVNDKDDYGEVNRIHYPLSKDSVVDIIPAVEGGGNILGAIALIIVGIFLIWVAAPLLAGAAAATMSSGLAAAATLTSYVGYGLVFLGMGQLLAPDPPKAPGDSGGESSTSFTGRDNITGQGAPIPIGYGRLLVGSNVISFINESSQHGYWRATSAIDEANGRITDVYIHQDAQLYTINYQLSNSSNNGDDGITVITVNDRDSGSSFEYTAGSGNGTNTLQNGNTQEP